MRILCFLPVGAMLMIATACGHVTRVAAASKPLEVSVAFSGYLVKQAYTEDTFVRQGQLLFQIDPQPFQAELDQAEGRLAQSQGQLAQSRAQLVQADAEVAVAEANQQRVQLDVDRYTPLVQQHAITQQDLDNATHNLGFTRLTAPIDGIPGIAQLQVGALVGPASGAITTVSTLDPVKVYFTISEREYLSASANSRLRKSSSKPGPACSWNSFSPTGLRTRRKGKCTSRTARWM